MKVGVIVFPGSNCDDDAVYAFEHIFGCETEKLWHKDTDLKNADLIFLPGGFSYGDYLRSGAIAKFSPIMQSVIQFAENGGLVWGVCNGFQILCESGLLPGTLLHNTNQQFICANVYITPVTLESSITSNMKMGSAYKIPIAHGEGRYYCDDDTLNRLIQNNQILLKYCNDNGIVTDDANPNGSLQNIAGICNEKRNVFGMMPHPERAVDPDLFNTDGQVFFESILKQKALIAAK